MSKKLQSTRAVHQRERLLDALRTAPITTLFAREQLDIYHCHARIRELRQQGHNIITYRETVDTGLGLHRVGKYVLLHGANHE